ncbi:type VI secretion protein [Erythrobacter sp. QSSC1-22B]|uniref:TrbG/VirB9 family P-type conjugative transfer protein n=1 Tax=Erythrobacter sp. QSSC1-22B TaxID=1860125 RepID=UPI0008053239|nr:TrbG/VirB9 family P-type conjugative transfer protein [Erythrobacter sp. QSSC1-22B]OBX19552.1 type VI secretion protein [Erythrobacter sp. QSSC1-22B]
MIRPTATALAVALFSATLAVPLSAQDDRLVEVPYDESRVVRVNGQVKVQATIRFDDSEAIENVAVGDSTAWQITPNKRANLLFVKPLEPRASTNMTVVTNKRTYLFDLVASPNAKPLYVLSFTYPDEPEEEPAQLADATTAAERDASQDPLAVLDPAELNFAWAGSGDAALLPVRTFDDGEAVFLTWPQGRPVPAILTTNAKGDEGPVNFTVREDVIVLDGVPREIVLRSGEEKAMLVNTGPVRPQRETRAETNSVSAGEVES